MKLRLIDENHTSKPLAYVVGITEADLAESVKKTEAAGQYTVINAEECDPVDVVHLRTHLSMLAVSDVLVLPAEMWWTSYTTHQLVHVAAWCGITLIDADGTEIPTTKKATR